ncbi:hypothetical protein AWZ03_010063 [Drosophila navojoa]|uniref:Uncharacterized protein n=1 Tax=Drosophila navojoa TaxID=7232 RepID=A0A484B626_DRONA|nr:hypothetical protein AWZ03_010063 [Drosophila navojoa]
MSINFYDNNGPIDVSTDHIYEGDVIGDRNSYVFGSIHNGVFEGKIITERDAYYVEHAKHYFPTNRTTSASASTTTSTSTSTSMPTTKTTATTLAPTTTGSNLTKTAIDNKRENFMNQIGETTTTTANTFPMYPTDNNTKQTEATTTTATTKRNEDELDFHSIIYKESHVEDAYENVREGEKKFLHKHCCNSPHAIAMQADSRTVAHLSPSRSSPSQQ